MKISRIFSTVFLFSLIALASVTKSSTVVANDITMTAGAGDVTSSDLDLTGAYHTDCYIRFTNGGTGPTVAPRVDVLISEDTTSGHYSKMMTVNGDTVNSSVNTRVFSFPDGTMHAEFTSGSNTGQAVTLRVVCTSITAI